MTDKLLDKLNLPAIFRDRVLCRVPESDGIKKSFVLYLPTVVLRKRHNPAFAFACKLANQYNIPLIILCTVLDDKHLSRKPLKPISMTARRLAFTLEALQCCTKKWEKHGAGVAVRVHGPGARNPHHLSLIHNAAFVVNDEPFVEPFRLYVRNIVMACHSANVPCFTVDGSTTVPPKSKLERMKEQTIAGDLCFSGVPSKAWIWEKQTDPFRRAQIDGATKDCHFDAPHLNVKLPPNFFLTETAVNETLKLTLDMIPSDWKCTEKPCPGQRPWTVEELNSITDVKSWSMECWPGADKSVPPCEQTHGSLSCAKERWSNFLAYGLKDYAKRRNHITFPHAVSRISCYLNLGILSIFDIIHNVWDAKLTRGYSTGCSKFLDEIVKWREIGYVHSFASPGYHRSQVLPKWSCEYLNRQLEKNGTGYEFEQMESALTKDETWNAMQRYLIDTGELHNNARMTWGKTVVHWQKYMVSPDDGLWHLSNLNDRFALDGLSPPSYAGILWCFGWGDKPGTSISTKPAHRYRTGANGFEQAKKTLLNSSKRKSLATRDLSNATPLKKPRLDGSDSTLESKTIHSYFSTKVDA